MQKNDVRMGHLITVRILAAGSVLVLLGTAALPALAEDANISGTASVQATGTTPTDPRFPGIRNIIEKPQVRFPAPTTTEGTHPELGDRIPKRNPVLPPNATSTMRIEAHASTTAARQVERQDEMMTKAKAAADTELSNRAKSLNALLAKIQGMVHVSAAAKASITATVNAQIAALGTLKAQIDADTGTTTLKTDTASITKSYRVYALVEPQIAILAAADRASSIADSLAVLSTKLSVRIASSTNASSLQPTLLDMNAKTADAKVQAQAAVAETASLVPDNGDKTVASANDAALKDARAKIQAAQKDLNQAQQDANKIVQGLKGTGHLNADVKTNTAAGTRTQQP